MTDSNKAFLIFDTTTFVAKRFVEGKMTGEEVLIDNYADYNYKQFLQDIEWFRLMGYA